MKRSRFIRVLTFVFSIALGVGLFVLLLLREDPKVIALSLTTFGVLPFIGYVAISLINFCLYVWRWQLIVNAQTGIKNAVSFWRMYLHRMGGYAVSYLTPAAQVGGEPARIALLATEPRVSLKQAAGSAILDIAFELVAFITFVTAGVVLAMIEGLGEGTNTLLVVIAGLFAVFLFLLFFFLRLARGRGFFVPIFRFFGLHKLKSLDKVEASITETESIMSVFLGKNPRLIGGIVPLSLLMISFRVVETFYIAWFFGVSLNFGQAFLVSTLPGLALLIPVPAGLGVFEGGFEGIFTLLAIPLSAVAFSLIIRARDAIFVAIGLIHMLAKGTISFRNNHLRKL
ncbi:MAG: lysylphosphatidylglycerol synthase transmembrane domain-containing protein [bacterium]|nr:lysylphosphatidylglycerol synthase transmembrane domain-containing protein [bacterium]